MANDDNLKRARDQARAQFDCIREMVDALRAARDGTVVTNDRGEEQDEDSCRQRIHEDALSVDVRSGWYRPGTPLPGPEEYQILLCTGGPAVRIVGRLDGHCEPETAVLQFQDWFTPWTDWTGEGVPDDVEAILLHYAREFYFGES